jgi:hypothetical protein
MYSYFDGNNWIQVVNGREILRLATIGTITPETIIRLPDGREVAARRINGIFFGGVEDQPPISIPITVPVPATTESETRRCPFCGEVILTIAIKCKHCGEFLERREDQRQENNDPVEMIATRTYSRYYLVVAIFGMALLWAAAILMFGLSLFFLEWMSAFIFFIGMGIVFFILGIVHFVQTKHKSEQNAMSIKKLELLDQIARK